MLAAWLSRGSNDMGLDALVVRNYVHVRTCHLMLLSVC